MPELSVFARISPKPAHRAEAKAASEGIIERTRAEPGCHRFELNVGIDGDPCLYLTEHWADDDALTAHYAEPHVADVFAAYGDWLERPVEVTKMRRAG